MRNKKHFRQAKVKKIQYQKTSFTTNVKGTYIVKKYKTIEKIYKINPRQLRNSNRNIYIKDYFKYKSNKCSNQNTQTGWMDEKTRPIYILSTRNPLNPHNKRKLQAKNTYRLKVRGWKISSMQMGSKRKLEQQFLYQMK